MGIWTDPYWWQYQAQQDRRLGFLVGVIAVAFLLACATVTVALVRDGNNR